MVISPDSIWSVLMERFIFLNFFLRMAKEPGSVMYKLKYTLHPLQTVRPQLINGPGDKDPNNHQNLTRGNATYCVSCN